MEKFEEILVKYFGGSHPIYDNATGGLTSSGKKAYKMLRDLISELSAINVLKKNEALETLKRIVETHVMYSKFSLSSDLNDLRLAVVGKTLYTYDSWNGSSMTIVVDGIELLTNTILFTGKNNWGNRSGIYVDKNYIKELISTGRAVKHNSIERCDVTTSWVLSDNAKK